MIFNGLPQRAASTSKFAEQPGEMRVAAGRRAPLHVNDPARAAGARIMTRKVDGKQLEPHIDDARRRRKQAFRIFVGL
jgi:hypothetical protein